jgi:beta-ketoacyl synthase-like protein
MNGAASTSTGAPRLFIEGPAFWAPTLPGWETARAAFRGEGASADPPVRRPAPQVLPPAERRRAPDTVALALEVAAAAVASAGRDARSLPCVFASAQGDLAISDYMCSTLADQPTLLSPTKFHNSVHNAAVGYWTIGMGCMRASNAISAYGNSFAAGLLEAAVQCAADQEAVLLVGYDIAAVGALASVTRSEGLLAAGMVLAPDRTAHSVAALDWSLEEGTRNGAEAPPWPEATRSLAGNAMADALPVFVALAAEQPQSLWLPVSGALGLALHVTPLVRQEG